MYLNLNGMAWHGAGTRGKGMVLRAGNANAVCFCVQVRMRMSGCGVLYVCCTI